jgi:hypothetical protein
MIQICLAHSTTEPTGNVAGWIVCLIDSASDDNHDGNDNHATTKAATTLLDCHATLYDSMADTP